MRKGPLIRNRAPEHRTYFKEWREAKRLSQAQLAELLGTSDATVSRMETGQTRYYAEYMDALAHVMRCHPRDFFRHPETPSIDSKLENAPPSLQQQIVQVVTALLGT